MSDSKYGSRRKNPKNQKQIELIVGIFSDKTYKTQSQGGQHVNLNDIVNWLGETNENSK